MCDFRSASVVLLAAVASLSSVAQAELLVTMHNPSRNAGNVALNAPISIHFNQAVDRATFTSGNFSAFRRWGGPVTGSLSFSAGDTIVTLTPDTHYFGGDPVTVVLSKNLRAANGEAMRVQGYSYRFTPRAYRATRSFVQIDRFSDRSASGAQTRIYGGTASDANRDGWLDLCLINEVSADMRVCLNRADGSGLFDHFLEPTFPLNFETSPNEPADFNGDGLVDICAASSATSVVSILLGNGDGTFDPQITVPVGNTPHGIAVLDADGDGDMDIATSNTGGNNVSLLLNPGNGQFTSSTSFDSGGNGEYALGAADMNEDGIMDLVVGNRVAQTIVVMLGQGNGTFNATLPRSAGGDVWMLVIGDVNGDGHEDVATANNTSATGSILIGGGDSTLQPAVTYPAAGGVVATDLGDMDGDGDVDWMLSSFGGGQYRMYRNNGNGTFTFDQSWNADSNAACCVFLDFDNDRDLDLALLDEIADTVRLMKNNGTTRPGDANCDGSVDNADIDAFVLALNSDAGYAAMYPNCFIDRCDVNGDGATDNGDIDAFVEALLS